jgi:hypothetical protein
MISGSVDSMIVLRSFPFFLKLWKLMLSILACFLWVGLAFVGFGDDVMIGASELNDIALKDGELMLDPDVDGINALLILYTKTSKSSRKYFYNISRRSHI